MQSSASSICPLLFANSNWNHPEDISLPHFAQLHKTQQMYEYMSVFDTFQEI